MIYLLAIAFLLSVLIFIHELGHFLAAKLFGVRVERFSIGFPPRLFGKKIGHTDYCISAIPFGGYVKLSGMLDESLDAESMKGEPQPHEFRSKSTFQKLTIISAGVIMNFVLAVGILSGIFWFKGERIYPNTTVGPIPEGSIAIDMGLQNGDKILDVNHQKIISWNEVFSTFAKNVGNDISITVSRAGDVVELDVPKSVLSMENLERLELYQHYSSVVGEVFPGTPAEGSGLQSGDKIIAINDKQISDWYDMTDVVRNNPDVELLVIIEREGETKQLSITPEKQMEKDPKGNIAAVGKIGIAPYVEFEWKEVPFGSAIYKGFNQVGAFLYMNVKGLAMVISGDVSARDALGGPIKIGEMAGEIAKTGFLNLLEFTALLSAILAVINILPIPALDGGHLLIIIIEGVRRKPISIKTKMIIQQVGMAILLLLMLFIFYNDISRLLN
jgi:regulator of sigma E protease